MQHPPVEHQIGIDRLGMQPHRESQESEKEGRNMSESIVHGTTLES
jgi:hypothetical protein